MGSGFDKWEWVTDWAMHIVCIAYFLPFNCLGFLWGLSSLRTCLLTSPDSSLKMPATAIAPRVAAKSVRIVPNPDIAAQIVGSCIMSRQGHRVGRQSCYRFDR